MSQRSTVVEIQRLADQVKDFVVVHSVRLWDISHDGSLWVHTSVVINIFPGYGNINTTIQTPYGEVVPVTMSWSSRFIEVDYGCLNIGIHMIHCVSPEYV